jgi:DNA invertase Pin-like site-specific DNA recombinase
MESAAVVGYIRLSREEQARKKKAREEKGSDGRAGLKAQEQAIRAECERRGWTVRIERDVLSGRSMDGREGLARALAAVESGEAKALVVAKLDRLGRSVRHVAELLERAREQGRALVVLDVGIDTSTIMGAAMAQMASVFAEMERRRIGERISEALAVKRAEGVRLGREPGDPRVRRRIRRLRSLGHSYQAIADRLNEDGEPTGQGGKRWYAATVRYIAGDYDKQAQPKRRKRAAA